MNSPDVFISLFAAITSLKNTEAQWIMGYIGPGKMHPVEPPSLWSGRTHSEEPSYWDSLPVPLWCDWPMNAADEGRGPSDVNVNLTATCHMDKRVPRTNGLWPWAVSINLSMEVRSWREISHWLPYIRFPLSLECRFSAYVMVVSKHTDSQNFFTVGGLPMWFQGLTKLNTGIHILWQLISFV